ncbi:MAG: thiamine-phosphate kinase [Lapillicoccus sp.]
MLEGPEVPGRPGPGVGPPLGGSRRPSRLPDGRTLADLSEDELLAEIFPIFASGPAALLGPGDDTALLATPDGSVVATTDTMVRDRDWRDAWSTGRDVGGKVVAQNLADVAAMGARPTGVLVTLVADPATAVDWVLEMTRGVAAACAEAGVTVLGGDLSSAPLGTLMVSVTALGTLDGRPPVLRSGARPGDTVALAGTLGLAAAGWRLLETHRADDDAEAVARQRCPRPPLAQGPVAATAGATSMIDLSDGLLRDAARVARASRVRFALEERALAPDVARLSTALGPELARECVLAGGEEHSLLATFASDASLPEGWRRVGAVSAGSGVTIDGLPERARGWDHFADR